MKTTTATCALLLAAALPAQDSAFVRDAVLGQMKWRALGPTNFGGRVVDIDVDPSDPSTWYIATGSGGLWKTVNGGTTFAPIFDDQATISIGDIAVSPARPEEIWVGTGEANNQRSSYWGDGVYKSTDGGETWRNVGLNGTDHIGRIAVHPAKPDVVFVAALGALYTPNEQRGLYRTTDGGASWERVAHVSDDVGFVDVVIDPKRPDTVYAASYERRRRAHDFDASGPGSGIWKSTDGGASFDRLEGGLPEGDIGRIGLALFAGDPDTVYATIENNNPAPPEKPEKKERGKRHSDAEPIFFEDDEAAEAPGDPKPVGGEIYRSDNAGKTWKRTNELSIGGRPAYYYGQIRVDPTDADKVYVLSVPALASTDGGVTWKTDFADALHVDHHALWIDPADPRHILLGNDGGLAQTFDRGATWDHLDHLPLGQFYAVSVDLSEPYHVYGGTQDNGSWGVPSRGATGRGLLAADAFKISGGDGFYVCVDPTDNDVVYSESQFGGLQRQNLRTGARAFIRPSAERGSPKLRFNWMSPLVLSAHNPRTLYFGSQHLHRSRDRGDTWDTISPDLTTNDHDKIAGNVPHCTITTIAESPLRPGLIYVGTDDGRVWVTRNDGGRWVDLTDRFAGLPKALWVSRVATSAADEDVAYVSFTGYREDIREPFLFLTTDGGESFRSISNDLPRAPINVVEEHPRNPHVLFVGTEFGVYASLDAGASWNRLGSGLPTTPVHDLEVHPRESDLVLGSHGRGLWVLDIAPLEDLTANAMGRGLVVSAPRDGWILPRGFSQGYTGARGWRAGNAELGAVFWYYLGNDSDEAITVSVEDATGKRLFRHRGKTTAGLHRVVWNPRGGGFGGFGGFGRGQGRQPAGPGQYVMRVKRGDREIAKPFWLHGADGMAEMFASDDWSEESGEAEMERDV